MNLVNARIRLNPQQLNFPLPTMYARQLHSFVAAVENIPDDVTLVVVSVFKVDGVSRFDAPVSRRPNSASGVVYFLPTIFPEVGASRYEVRATDAYGHETALGGGLVEVAPFSPATERLEPGVPVVLQTILDASGAAHTISAVPDGEGGFTSIIDA